ncbi:hypothetical protein MMH89_02415 [Candidatus Comchoanobacter bicostacola]|uniref:Uncharacterized protein n=1 Tax=Candidatus Comchoanobacter bicostacola TaxID=2919598 RepID=A0ABY5DIF8_9GAMM|nr:hypothetical protein [Candidatus Comchoanobacter bicostacola]UTC24080.1 hypothetical protein MMH89_02415 [Candidatus Comchoanobacter bicostacola]
MFVSDKNDSFFSDNKKEVSFSNKKQDESVMFHLETNQTNPGAYLNALEKQIRAQYKQVSVTKRIEQTKKTCRYAQVSFTYLDGNQPTAATVTLVSNQEQMIVVNAQAEKTSIKKSLKKSKSLARSALFFKVKELGLSEIVVAGAITSAFGLALLFNAMSNFSMPMQ